MGMYDTFKSSYNIGEEFTNVICQTKDIDDFCGGTMTDYWLSPDGVLWGPMYTNTHELKVLEEGDPEYNEKLKFLNFKWIPTGNHGRFKPYNLTKYIEIYPVDWKGDYNDRPRMRLHFRNGILQDFTKINS